MQEVHIDVKTGTTTHFLAPLAVITAFAGFFVALVLQKATTPQDALISLAALALLIPAAFYFPKISAAPLLLTVSLASYVSLTLIANGQFTWQSETAALHPLGLGWVFAVFAALFAVFGRLAPAAIAGGALTLIFGFGSAVMTQFRGRLLLAGDLTALRTALNVAGNFSLDMPPAMITAVLLQSFATALLVWFSRRRRNGRTRRVSIISRLAALTLALAFALSVGAFDLYERAGIRITWNENDFEESPVLYFAQSVEQLRVSEPAGYSEDALEADAAVANPLVAVGKQPHVIVIMDEAFSDLTMIGEFETTEPVTPFIDSLRESTISGHVYASVYGGSTANSEFEFLTGLSMANVGRGISPYQQYIKYEKDTMVSLLEEQGYTSLAMHPYDISGWNREAVYDCFGFDSVHFIEDFKNKKYLRGYVTDESNFANLITWFEERDPGERMFIFNITMQNHSSYKNESYASTVGITGHEGEFPWAEQYLSLLRETDSAVEGLLEYFAAQEEPVIVLFYGDHQPALEDEFYEMLYGKASSELSLEERQRKYLTPFFIWANYEIEPRDAGLTSINFLGPMLLDAAGLQKSGFGAWLLELQAEFPVINAFGAVDASGEHVPPEDERFAENLLVQRYKMLQYNYLFDTAEYLDSFFSLPEIVDIA